MKKFGKRMIAMSLAGVLALTPATAFADGDEDSQPASEATTEAAGTTSPAKGETTGDGKVEGWVEKDVFNVVLPTIAEDDTTFQFIVDPQDLIGDTDGAAYSGITFDENDSNGLYFLNADGDTYSSTSQKLRATNKSTMDVDVTLTAKVDTKFTLAETDEFTDDTNTSIYLALNSGTADAPTTKALAATTGATIDDASIEALADAYEVTYADGKYSYALKSTLGDDDFNSLDFWLTGACNQTEGVDWSALKDETPTVTVSWTLKDSTSSKDITVTKTASSTAAITVTTAAEVTSAQYVKVNGAANTNTLKKGTQYTVSGTSFTLTSAVAKALTSGDTVVTLTLSDGTTQTLTITVQ